MPLTRMRGAKASAIVRVRVHNPAFAKRIGDEIGGEVTTPA